MKMVVKVGPASLGDTPPSSDSGIHSLGEQWENMSISTADTEAEQNGRPTSCNTTGRRDSDTRVPPNTEEDEDVVCPWLDCLLNEDSDEFSSVDIANYRKDIQYNEMTICREEYSLVDSGTDGGNSDIGVLADFSDNKNESQLKQFSDYRIPGCQCEGRIEYMEWGSEDMTDTDDTDEREKRLYVERYNFDLIEGMTHLTYTPPTRKYRRRRYEDRVKIGPLLQESTSGTSEWESQTDEESLNSEPTVQPGTVADEDIPTHGDEGDRYGTHELTGLTECDTDSPSGELSENVNRPVMKSVTARPELMQTFPVTNIPNLSTDRSRSR